MLMKIKLAIGSLHAPPTCDVLLLQASAEKSGLDVFSACKRFAAANPDVAVISAPFVLDNRLCMAYVYRDVAHIQASCFLPATQSGLFPVDDVLVFDTHFGRAALACGADIFQPQYARLAALKGCQILFANPGRPLTEAEVKAAPWSVCQANNLFVAVATPKAFQLLAPCMLTPDNAGFVPDEVADVSLLAKSYASFPIFDSLNPAFYKRYHKELIA